MFKWLSLPFLSLSGSRHLESSYPRFAGFLPTRFFGSTCVFPVSSQSTDLPNSRLIANSTRNRRHDPEPHLPRALAGIFSLTLVSIKLLLQASLGILNAHQCAQGNLECLTANRADSDRGSAPEMFY